MHNQDNNIFIYSPLYHLNSGVGAPWIGQVRTVVDSFNTVIFSIIISELHNLGANAKRSNRTFFIIWMKIIDIVRWEMFEKWSLLMYLNRHSFGGWFMKRLLVVYFNVKFVPWEITTDDYCFLDSY